MILGTSRSVRVFAYPQPVDLRKGYDGLFGFVKQVFGAERVDLGRVAGPLREQQQGRCFYCGSRLGAAHVDHFLPWARYPDDRLENLVVADAKCNTSKSHHLASVEHVERWLERFDPARTTQARLREIAEHTAWPTGGVATLAVARHLYHRHPVEARLWHGVDEFRPWERTEVESRLARATSAMHAGAP